MFGRCLNRETGRLTDVHMPHTEQLVIWKKKETTQWHHVSDYTRWTCLWIVSSSFFFPYVLPYVAWACVSSNRLIIMCSCMRLDADLSNGHPAAWYSAPALAFCGQSSHTRTFPTHSHTRIKNDALLPRNFTAAFKAQLINTNQSSYYKHKLIMLNIICTKDYRVSFDA